MPNAKSHSILIWLISSSLTFVKNNIEMKCEWILVPQFSTVQCSTSIYFIRNFIFFFFNSRIDTKTQCFPQKLFQIAKNGEVISKSRRFIAFNWDQSVSVSFEFDSRLTKSPVPISSGIEIQLNKNNLIFVFVVWIP